MLLTHRVHVAYRVLLVLLVSRDGYMLAPVLAGAICPQIALDLLVAHRETVDGTMTLNNSTREKEVRRTIPEPHPSGLTSIQTILHPSQFQTRINSPMNPVVQRILETRSVLITCVVVGGHNG